MNDLKRNIEEAIKQIRSGDLFETVTGLFETLGYNTQRRARLERPAYEEFKTLYLDENANIKDISKFEEKAQTAQWQRIELLFQLTDEEMGGKDAPFESGRFDDSIIDAYLFFALELKPDHYSRTQLAHITRQINKVFAMPVMVVFKNQSMLTLSVIKRRLHKKDLDRDVLEKVTLIKDINTIAPHRAHIEILCDLSLEELKQKVLEKGKRKTITNFVQLQTLWMEVLDSSHLNKKFFREIAAWYFWAVGVVEFPDGGEEKKELRNATAVIRLLTRLIFVWFIKEKGVVPGGLFNPEKLSGILKNFDNPGESDSTIYYKAILQNLFFATLSTEQADREFRSKNWKHGRNIHYGNQYVYRYEEMVKSVEEWQGLFTGIPFLNGGLFENLDNKETRQMVDGFSEETRNNLSVPDCLFFSPESSIDLNVVYDTSDKKYKVTGLINILDKYKFTVMENTPIEEEIALDPELLGKVFENLLANFNPETQATARKQTGSFYTPREIVDYMVDESLKTSLSHLVSGKLAKTSPGDIQTGFDILFAYTEEDHLFNPQEVKAIVKAVSEIKILDPACGSGAFPMGILHKLVFILNKLDPDNEEWRSLHKEKAEADMGRALDIPESEREERKKWVQEIEETFTSNTSNYGRKLFLIENAIYGVDVQPIAVQIAKLRFFISLIVDQDMKKNVKPLPNLETKFVAADTLICREKAPEQGQLFDNPKITKLEKELKKIRHKHFNARSPKEKMKLRKQDKEKRDEISKLIDESDGDEIRGNQLKAWDPYDQNHFAPFFDSEWMYGITDGFDIVIGNPPYVQIQRFSGQQKQKDWEKQEYETFVKTGDIYSLFYERGNMLLKEGGVLAYITSNKWMRANYGKKTRKYFAENTNPLILIDLRGFQVFDSVTVDTNILVFEKGKNKNNGIACNIDKDFAAYMDLGTYVDENAIVMDNMSEEIWTIASKDEFAVKKRIDEIGTPLKDWDILINYGINTGFNEAFIIDGKKKDELIAADPKSAEIIKPILRGRDIKRYKANFEDLWIVSIFPALAINIDNYPAVRDYLKSFGKKLNQDGKTYKDEDGFPQKSRKKTANKWFETQDEIGYYKEFEKEIILWGNLALNAQFALTGPGMYVSAPCPIISPGNKYVLAVLNSTVGDYYIRSRGVTRNGGYFEYKPMFVEKLPVPKITVEEQLPFEILVDCILFAKEKGMKDQARILDWVIDVMVYDLYFEDEMKRNDCFISDRVKEVIKPFKADDTPEFKTEYIKKLAAFCRDDKTISRGMYFSRTVRTVKIINGEIK